MQSLEHRAILVWKIRWKFGTSSGWGSEGEGLVKVAGNMVGTCRKQGVHWVSKVVKAMIGAAERRAVSQNELYIVKKDETTRMTSQVFR